MFGGNKFDLLGMYGNLSEKCEKIGWKEPTEIQRKVIPLMLRENDVVALAETGSGKTGAFAIPIIQKLFDKPKYNYALILTPTHELAIQIKKEFMKLGEEEGLKVATIVGGEFIGDQIKLLKSNKFHIFVGTPGRVLLHMNNKLLDFKRLRFLVLDEADRMLSDDFVNDLTAIIEALPKQRYTCLFSATMTNKLEKLEKVCVKNPVRVEVSRKHQTVSTLTQQKIMLPDEDERVLFLVWKLESLTNDSDENQSSSVIVFTETKKDTKILFHLLSELDIPVAMLQSDMSREERQRALDRFSTGKVTVLVATDVASRGLDIPNVGLVINFEVPDSSKDYLHRVGRTARAGRSGLAISLVTVYTFVDLVFIERDIGVQMQGIEMPRNGTAELRDKVMDLLESTRKKIKDETQLIQERQREENKGKNSKNQTKKRKINEDATELIQKKKSGDKKIKHSKKTRLNN